MVVIALSPVQTRLQRAGVPRWLATAAVDGGFRVIAEGQPYQVLELTEVLELLRVERADRG